MLSIRSTQSLPSPVLAWTIIVIILGFVCHAIQASADTSAGATVARDGPHQIPKTFDYGEYVEKYRKSYTPVETLEKARYFFSRTMAIFKHNILYVSKKVSHYLRQTEYTDLTPNEMKQMFKHDDSGLQPVKEAHQYPDLPADQLWSVTKLESNPDEEKISMSAAVEPVREFRKPVLNFLADEGGHQPTNDDKPSSSGDADLLAELIKQKVNKKDLARLMSLSSDSDHNTGEDVSEKARRLRGIKYKAVVEADNGHYDPGLLPSQGILENMELMGNNYAKFMMDDFMADVQPYPSPTIPRGRVLSMDNRDGHGSDDDRDGDDPKKPALFSLMKSVKNIFDFFAVELADEVGIIDVKDDDDNNHNADVKPDSRNKPGQQVETDLKNINNNNNNQVVDFEIDWRKSGCISRPRTQGNCNSCYAFATLDLMEFFYCRQKKSFTEFSVQYVIDCGSKTNLNGCSGGKLSLVGLFIQKYGLQLESYYPYRASESTCPFEEADYASGRLSPLKPELKGWRMFQEMAAWYKWLPKSPIIVGVNMPGDFLAYGGGVHDGSDCVPGMVHAMLLVGSGTHDGHPFWLIKNTFSADWGEEGYFRLSKKAPLRCFNSVVVARVNFDAATTG